MNDHYKYTYTYNGMPFDPEQVTANYQYRLSVLSDQVEAELQSSDEFPLIQELLKNICCN